MLLGTRAVPDGAVQRGNSSAGLLPLHPSAYCASTGCFSLFLTRCVSTRLCPALPGRGELPLPRPRVPPCAVATPPTPPQTWPLQKELARGVLAAAATELRIASSWWTPAPGHSVRAAAAAFIPDSFYD